MNDYALGTNLRRQLLADQQRGIRQEPRRLQALAGDFCADEQLALLPALKYLVLTPAFHQALGHNPPLPPDPHLLLQLQQELNAVFAATISDRMGTVLRGLLSLPAAPPARPAADPITTFPITTTPITTTPITTPPLPPARPASAVVVLLSFIAGVLVVGVMGAFAWMLHLNRQSQPLLPEPLSEPQTPASDASPSAPELPVPAAPNLEQAELDRAISTVQQLYSHLSRGDTNAARQLIGAAASDQFDPSFFSQFSQVSVGDLVETGRSGSTVQLTGLVTFTYPDGTSQVESRSFSVDTASDPGVVTASGFQAVVQPR